MNIDILVQNANSSIHGINATSSVNSQFHSQTVGDALSATTDDSTTTTTWTTDDGKLSPMAIHFLAVGALFAAVLVLATVNAYLHFRSQRRRRRFQAPPPPVERTYSQRRRTRRGGSAASTAGDDWDAQSDRRPRMTMRMKPTKMFTGSMSN